MRTRPAVIGLLLAAALAACSSASGSAGAGTAGASETATAAPRVADASGIVPAGTCRGGVCTHRTLAAWDQVPFTPRVDCGAAGRCRLHLDVLAPATGGQHPVVVVLAGGPNAPRGQRYADAASLPLAARGVVVMRADWRQGGAWGGRWPTAVQDVACAVGYARRVAASYGGRPDDVVLAGHSLGGWMAAVVGLTPAPFTPRRGGCLATRGPLRPDAVVSLSGAVDEVRHQGLGAAALAEFFGGPRSRIPRVWAAADPFALVRRYEPARRPATFTLLRGGRDAVISPSAAPDLAGVLRRAGFRTRYVVAPRATHNGILVAPPAVRAVLAAT
jgi:acetyl esterase/lipase